MKKLLLAAATALAVGAGSAAQAAVIFLETVTPTGGGQNFYSYRIEFADDEGVQTGSTLVIYDFAGYVDGSITAGGAPGISVSTEPSSALPSFGFTDDPSITNLVFTYNGPTLDVGGAQFSGFGAASIFSGVTLDGFSALTVKVAGDAEGTIVASQGGVGVPAAIPEPGTWALMIGGFGLVGASLRRRTALRAA